VAGGLRIVRAHAQAPGQEIDASGDWLGRGAAARTRLQATVATRDFGALLEGFGYGGQLAEGSGSARFDGRWPGSPGDFAATALDGTLALDVADGRLVELEPGAGRVLGLLGIAQLPRRLTLDFHDFFDKGFAFDRLKGLVRVADGKASSDDLEIAGPAAEIRIRGTADLRAQTFDQAIEVVPRAGNLLTAVGALAGGPVGAAIGAAANAVLRKPLGQLTAKSYRVTGPWKEPKVEVASRAPANPAPAPAPVPPSD
ncbi:MAG: YhdP family protein, partial [Luteimonas sp.]